MSNQKDPNFIPSARQDRILPEDTFGDWKWREALAELMVPVIGTLYRNGINTLVYGKSLVNQSPIELMRAHRFARQSDNNELSEFETYPILLHLASLQLKDCEVDIGELAVRCPFFDRLKEDQTGLETYINEQLKDVIGFDSKRPSVPTNIVLYGFGRVGRLIARMLVQTTGPGNYFRLSAIVIRKASDDDIYKRAQIIFTK